MTVRSKYFWINSVFGALLIPISFQTLQGVTATPLTPSPIILVFLCMVRMPFVLVVATAGYCFWNKGLFDGETVAPRRSFLLFGITGTLSIIASIANWNVQGYWLNAYNVHTIIILNCCFIALLVFVAFQSKRKRNFAWNLCFHWLLFVWLTTYAFPEFGEPL